MCKISAHVVALNVKLGLKLKRTCKENHNLIIPLPVSESSFALNRSYVFIGLEVRAWGDYVRGISA